MKLIGEFREGEIDGKPFFIYFLSSKKDKPSSSSSPSSSGESAIDSGADNDLSPLFMCPSVRSLAELEIKEAGGYAYNDSRPFTISPHFQSWLDFDCGNILTSKICKLPPAPIYWCNYKEPDIYKFICHACLSIKFSSSYYFCFSCNNMFHKECVESPLEIKHPSYPFHSLQLYGTSQMSSGSSTCSRCEFRSCLTYRCPIRKFNIDLICAMNPIPTLIDHPKRHPHPLSFFPQQAFLQCHVCGLVKDVIPTYVCVQCVFVVHQDCVYSPYVIQICRHQHRISFIYSLPSTNLICGVCRQNIVSYCGAYKCTTCSDYFVHTRCALRKDVWDGIELDGVPEEPEIDLEPFKRISDGIILYFSHVHPLELKISKVYDDNKICQACVLPVYEGKYYSCMDECDFILHEECANAPRKKHSILHAHQLILKVVNNGYEGRGYFVCDACQRKSCGFVYESIGGKNFRLDVRCALISEPFEYQGHKRPLFLALSLEEEKSVGCKICQGQRQYESGYKRKLNCIECNFVICFYCATLPYKAGYKHDSHLLTFYEMKEAKNHSEWCDVCERKIAHFREIGFYSCDECCTTLHVDCLLGRDMCMKPGQTIHYEWDFDVIRNNTMSRTECLNCARRCIHKLVFTAREESTFCSIRCAFEF